MARVLHLTDLHVVRPGTLASGVLDTPALLRRAVDIILRRLDAVGPLDAVLVTGDVSDDGSEESYEYARAELDRLGLPLLVVPGNHDRREPLRRVFRDLSTMPRTGPIDWVADLGDARIIGLDTLVEGSAHGRLQEASLDLVREAARDAGERAITIALHHPPLRTGIRFMDAIGLENAADLAAALRSTEPPLRILAGHVHGVYYGRLDRHAVLTAPSVCSAIMLDLRKDARIGFMTGPTGYALFDTSAGGVWSAQTLAEHEGPHGF